MGKFASIVGFGFRLCSFLSRCVGFGLLRAPEEALNPRPVTKQKAALKAAQTADKPVDFLAGFVFADWIFLAVVFWQ
ncbi:hypothetical protein E0H70_33120, partial [Rhizobium leguminosarum bv. viciae]